MKIVEERFYTISKELVEIGEVNMKEVFLLEVKKPVYISYLKDVIRDLSVSLGVDIRHRIDIGEENWLGRDFVFGQTAVVLRTKEKLNNKIVDEFNNKLNEKGLFDTFEFLAKENYDVHDFRNITEKYNRALYSVVLNVGSEVVYDISESKGGWKQQVLQWNGEVAEERVDGVVRVHVSSSSLSEGSDVYKVLIDAPYGLDITRMLEQEFSLKKGSLEGYPVKCERIYEGVDEKKRLLGRAVCPVFGTTIERTIGGNVGEKSIRAFLGDKDSVVVKGNIKSK